MQTTRRQKTQKNSLLRVSTFVTWIQDSAVRLNKVRSFYSMLYQRS